MTQVSITNLAYAVEVRLREVQGKIRLEEEERRKHDLVLSDLHKEKSACEDTIAALGQLESANVRQIEVK